MTNEGIKAGDKLWLAKYALSEGVVHAEVQDTAGLHSVKLRGRWDYYQVGKWVFHDRADAVKAAEALRTKKLASLKKQLQKLEGMTFA